MRRKEEEVVGNNPTSPEEQVKHIGSECMRLAGFLFVILLSLQAVAGTHPAESPLTLRQQQQWRSQIKSTLYITDPLPPLDPQVHSRFEPTPEVVAERLTLGSQFGMKIPAILYLPKSRSGKLPALVVVNGHGGDKYSWYAFYSGMLYARAGAVVLTFDPAGEGERNIDRKSGTRAHDVEWTSSLRPGQAPPPKALACRLAGLLMTDVMQAVSYLCQRPEVDAERIGAMGYSVGSFILNLAGAVDCRLHACVLAGGGNLDGPGEIWDNSKPLCTGVPYQSLSFLGDRPAVLYALRASCGPTLVINGLADDVVNIPRHGASFFEDLQARVIRLKGNSQDVFETEMIPKASHRPHFLTRIAALWLERQLDFPNWTEKDILAMPETHINDWAQSHGVEVDPYYASEEREGGTRALGQDVQGIARKDLNVFTNGEWQRQKDKLVFEVWLKEAKARIAAGQES